jgi:mannose-6-phosphate isomerase-like protein (cupin superfamily)
MNVAHIRRFSPNYPVFGTDLTKSATMSLRATNGTPSTLELHPKSDQTVSVLSGVLTAETDSDEAELSEGDTLLVPAGVKHRFRSKTGESIVAVSTYHPNKSSLHS